MMPRKISVLLVDDHAGVRTGYKTYLSLSDIIGEIYEADQGESACQVYNQHHPDIVILDISIPGIGGFETIRRLMICDPQCKILVFSIHDELVYVTRARRAIAHFLDSGTSVSPNAKSEQRIGKPRFVLRPPQLRTKAAPLRLPH